MADYCTYSNEYPSILSLPNSKNKENPKCRHWRCSSNYNSSESSSEFHFPTGKEEQKLDYEKFKKILQQSSSKSGDNLYDHLVAIIKRIIDERPINVADYFEQFSRMVREKKKIGYDSIEEPQFFELAKSVIEFMKPSDVEDRISFIEEFEELCESEMTIYQSSDSTNIKIQRCFLDSENIFQTQHFFAFCGLGFNVDEVFQLSLSVQKVQLHSNVENARFWGRIFGLHGSYYVVEAELTRTEIEKRRHAMKLSLLDEMKSFISKKECFISSDPSDIELNPGSKWQSFPKEDLQKMQQPIAKIPQLEFKELFHGPEEPVGSGLNRKTYFVTNSLSSEWQELPTVAPRHIQASKKIKKYFTGDLNVSMEPLFPGNEKHYLRAMIARITSGTFIAPKSFYRRLTRKEMKLAEDNDEVIEEEFESEDGDDFNNDTLIKKNINYKQLSLEEAALPSNWVHVRPNILNQGRILHLNEELAIKNLEKKAILSMNGGGDSDVIFEDIGEHEYEDEDLQEEESEVGNLAETGPELFSACNKDRNNEGIPSWTSRYSSVYNKINQMILMRSNLWPGAYSIVFENFCDCIYLGWGFKYVARCSSLQELPVIQEVDYADIAEELNDPTVEMEEKWRKYHMKKNLTLNDDEEMSDISVEVDFDDED